MAKFLIYGAGVIGSIFAVKLASAGHEVTVYARSSRLENLMASGLLYDDLGVTRKADVVVTGCVNKDEMFDYVLVAVRYDQVETALKELKTNNCPNIVTLVNNPLGYSRWEEQTGSGRIIAGFPGAGGRLEDGILHFRLTPAIIQKTTIGEPNGSITPRIRKLSKILKQSKIPFAISKKMEDWQKSHLALVIPLANGIYLDGGTNYTTARNKEALHHMSFSLKENFRTLKRKGITITPWKYRFISHLPKRILEFGLRKLYESKFAEDLIYSHAIKARNEMMLLENDFYRALNK